MMEGNVFRDFRVPADATRQFMSILTVSRALILGSIETETGFVAPYFADFSRISSGRKLSLVASIYASVLIDNFGDSVNAVFGPSYSGIASCVATAEQLTKKLQKDVAFTFERKAPHVVLGSNLFVGHQFNDEDQVVIIDDALMTGGTIKRSIGYIQSAGAKVIGALVGLDRQDCVPSGVTARQDIETEFGIPVISIASSTDIENHFRSAPR